MAVMLREETEETLEAMDRFELKALVEVVKGMGLEPMMKKKLINEVMKADKWLQLVYQMMEQKKQPEVGEKRTLEVRESKGRMDVSKTNKR